MFDKATGLDIIAPMMISSVVLAAGLSTRFGAPKALASWGATTVIDKIIDVLLVSKVDQIVLVLGAWGKDIEASLKPHPKITLVHNNDYLLGQTSSFQCGLKMLLPQSAAAFLVPVDCPCIQPQTYEELIEAFLKSSRSIVPTYLGRKGHPPLFNKELLVHLEQLPVSLGINSVLSQMSEKIDLLEVSDARILATFNTPEELASLQKSYR